MGLGIAITPVKNVLLCTKKSFKEQILQERLNKGKIPLA